MEKGWARRSLGKCGGVLALLLILIALFVQLGRQLTPLVSENHVWLENYLSKQLQAQVSVDTLDASWRGFRPEISFSELTVVNADGETALSIGRGVAQVGLLQSLWDWSLRFWRIEADRAKAVLTQTPDGLWELSGVTLPAAKERSDPLFSLLDGLAIARFVRFNEVGAEFHFISGRRQQLGFTQMLLENDSGFQRLTADLDLSEQDDAVKLAYEINAADRQQGPQGRGYLKLTHYPIASAAAFISEDWLTYPGIEDGLINAEFWLQTAVDSRLSAEGMIEFTRPADADNSRAVKPGLEKTVSRAVNPLPLRAITQFTAEWRDRQDWSLSLQDFQTFWPKQASLPLDVSINRPPNANAWSLQVPSLDAGEWLQKVVEVPEVPDKVKAIVSDLGAVGRLKNIHVVIPEAQPLDFVLKANLENMSVNAWKASPQITGVYGYLEASAYSGFVELDSQQELLLGFPQLFDAPFEFKQGQGVVGWTVRPDENSVQVYSGRLSLNGELGEANGYFYLDAPFARNSRPLELALHIGVQNAKAADHKKLVPGVLPDTLLKWLDQAIVEGRVPAGGFVLHGYFGHEASRARSIQLALDVNHGELNYDPRWPPLKNLSGYLEVDTDLVQGWLDEGAFLQTRLQPTYLEVGPGSTGKGLLLQLNGEVSGDAQSGLDVLTQTPLHEVIGGGLDSWQMTGKLGAKVQLQIPLSADQAGGRQQVDVTLRQSTLMMTDLNLAFTDVNGALQYRNDEGLSSNRLTANLWQQPLDLAIDSFRKQPQSGWETGVHFKGPLDVSQLALWTRRPEALFVEGIVPVTGTVSVAGGDTPVRVRAQSSLEGALIDLPPPYGKAAGDIRSLTVDVPVGRSQTEYRLTYDDLVSVRLRTVGKKSSGSASIQGVVALGQLPSQRRDPGIWLEGVADEVDGKRWWQVIERYQALSDSLTARIAAQDEKAAALVEAASPAPVEPAPPAAEVKSEPSVLTAPALNFDVLVKKFIVGSSEFQTIKVGGGQRQNGWRVDIHDELVSGNVFISGDGSPLNVNLKYVRWPEAKDSDTEVDWSEKLEGFRPQDMIDMDLTVAELSLGTRHFGRWSLKSRATDAGLLLTEILGQSGDFKLFGLPEESLSADKLRGISAFGPEGASMLWLKNDRREGTRFYGRVTGKNMDDAAEQWGLPKMLNSEAVKLDAAVRWRGSPLDFSADKLRGTLKVDIENGHFYRSTGQTSDAFLRLVGLFNFDSWIRRLQLDFSDVFQGGTPFEQVQGTLKFDHNMIYLSDPFEVSNTSSVLKMGGEINIEDETLDTSLVATLPVGGNATLIAAFAAGLPAAAGVYAISKIFKKQMERVASVSYSIQGPWADPKVEFDKLFDNKAADKAASDSRQAEEARRSEDRARRKAAREDAAAKKQAEDAALNEAAQEPETPP
ncbi:hypothetical protein GCM10027217_06900 [Pseudomaricurvus hydrocarbonicus]